MIVARVRLIRLESHFFSTSCRFRKDTSARDWVENRQSDRVEKSDLDTTRCHVARCFMFEPTEKRDTKYEDTTGFMPCGTSVSAYKERELIHQTPPASETV